MSRFNGRPTHHHKPDAPKPALARRAEDALFFDCFGYPGKMNPYDQMRSLGIRWQAAEAQPMADQIKFMGCTEVPDPLPAYLRRPRS